MSLKVVIIGGVAAGPKVASRIVRLCPEAEVTLFEKGEFLSYAGCGLPYYVSGVVKDQAELMSTPVGTVRDSIFFQNVKNVHVCNHTEVMAIDRTKKTVVAKSLKDGKLNEVKYDKLVMATGATPFVPPIAGRDLEHVYTLHGVEDAEGIKASFKNRSAQDVTIVGGGLIGIEMAEAFAEMGARVTIVEAMDQILAFLDKEMAYQVVKHLNAKGVKVMSGTKVLELSGSGSVEKVITDKGEIACDIAIVAVGVRPSTSLAKAAGLEVGPTGGIVVNDKMQTSDNDIYAAGDCVEMKNLITGKPCYVPLGSTANKQGRVAASNICNHGNERFPGVLGTAICKVFDFAVAATGLSEKAAKAEGYDYITLLTPAPDKAHFYPTAKTVMLKLVVDKATRRLLGMQGVGPGDVDKRIDVAATAISAKMTVDDIANLDLAYAPPYSPAMDNILTAANIARNKLDGIFDSISPMEVKAMMDAGDDMFLLDVRTPDEFQAMRIEGGTLIPLGKVRSSLNVIPRDKPVIAYCKISLRGYEAALILKANGYTNVKVMDGGVIMWPYEIVS